MVTSMLPTLTIIVLYFVNPPLVRIGLVVVFTALFSLALSFFTSAPVEGIFTATATQVTSAKPGRRQVANSDQDLRLWESCS